MTNERQQNEADGEINYLKVGFIGPGGTGKTEVCKLLEKDPSVLEPFIPSVVRGVFRRLGITSESQQNSMSLKDRWFLQRELAVAKFKQDKEYPFGIFDRTPIDHFNYGLYRCAGVIPEQEFKDIQRKVAFWMEHYDLLYFFPIYDWGGQAHRDGFREEGLAYRYTTQYIMKGLLEDMDIPYKEMPNTSPVDRALMIAADINGSRSGFRPNRNYLTIEDEGEGA